jgi:hypothetical protein
MDELGDLRVDRWVDGSAVVYLWPMTGEQVREAPRLPVEPSMQRAFRWFGYFGVALVALAVAGIVLGVRTIGNGQIAAGSRLPGWSADAHPATAPGARTAQAAGVIPARQQAHPRMRAVSPKGRPRDGPIYNYDDW